MTEGSDGFHYKVTATDFEPDGSWRPGPDTMALTPAGLTPAQVEMALFMACLSCGLRMRRGTQCRNCGAWCR